MTVYEAAVWRGDLEMWRLLLRAIPPLDGALIDRLRCLDQRQPSPALREALMALPARPRPDCGAL